MANFYVSTCLGHRMPSCLVNHYSGFPWGCFWMKLLVEWVKHTALPHVDRPHRISWRPEFKQKDWVRKSYSSNGCLWAEIATLPGYWAQHPSDLNHSPSALPGLASLSNHVNKLLLINKTLMLIQFINLIQIFPIFLALVCVCVCICFVLCHCITCMYMPSTLVEAYHGSITIQIRFSFWMDE